MSFENSYCFIAAQPNSIHKHYHDHEYGFPVKDDQELFTRLMLEVNQAGLSWTVIIKKQAKLIAAYHNFDLKTLANFTEEDIEKLLNNPDIIRNRLKVQAAIFNAQAILKLQSEFGSFHNWLKHHHPLTKSEWVKLFKQHFKFTGGEITGEFLMSIGFLPGAHHPDCPIYEKVLLAKPAWANV